MQEYIDHTLKNRIDQSMLAIETLRIRAGQQKAGTEEMLETFENKKAEGSLSAKEAIILKLIKSF